MKGLGTREHVLCTVVGSRSRYQRERVVEAYTTNYKRDLRKDLKSETSGHRDICLTPSHLCIGYFRRLLATLVLPEEEADASFVRWAVKKVS